MATKNSASGGAYAPEARQRISKLGPESLPDNPSGKGLTARQIKSALAWGLYYLFDLAARKEEENVSELSGKVEFRIPDEKGRRHGQAVAAASLPVI